MKILVVGAGATGGYFGARLVQAGCDVTFLVRAARAETLARTGLVVKSPTGDFTVEPKLLLSEQIDAPFDLILLSCKAYDLDAAIDSIRPAVGSDSMILPILNGMAHLERLAQAFGRERVLGGLCMIGATLDGEGRIVHLADFAALVFGELDMADATRQAVSARVAGVAEIFKAARFESRASINIQQDMWEKWMYLASLACASCLMRGTVGDIMTGPAGAEMLLGLFDQICSIATANGYAPRPDFIERSRKTLSLPGSRGNASMLRDLENNGRVEADHVVGDLIARGASLPNSAALNGSLGLVRIAYLHLKTYEARRARLNA
jgi:2-dehydropantoate 2-reductase